MAQGPDECHRDRTAVMKKAGPALGAGRTLAIYSAEARPQRAHRTGLGSRPDKGQKLSSIILRPHAICSTSARSIDFHNQCCQHNRRFQQIYRHCSKSSKTIVLGKTYEAHSHAGNHYCRVDLLSRIGGYICRLGTRWKTGALRSNDRASQRQWRALPNSRSLQVRLHDVSLDQQRLRRAQRDTDVPCRRYAHGHRTDGGDVQQRIARLCRRQPFP